MAASPKGGAVAGDPHGVHSAHMTVTWSTKAPALVDHGGPCPAARCGRQDRRGGFSQAPECYRSPAARSGRSWKFARSVAIGGRVAVWAKLRANASLSLHMFISGSGEWPVAVWACVGSCALMRRRLPSAHTMCVACALSSNLAVRFERQRATECGAFSCRCASATLGGGWELAVPETVRDRNGAASFNQSGSVGPRADLAPRTTVTA